MRFSVIYADPCWQYRNWNKAGERKNAVRHYSCLTVEQIAAFPVDRLAADDCALFLWVTGPFLMPLDLRKSLDAPAALVARSWGFSHYGGKAFSWAKRTPTDRTWHFGAGYWSRKNTEDCLLFTKGSPKRLSASVPELVVAPRGRHSEKPREVHDRIERLVAGPYCELFAREARPGWTTLGNEIDGLDLAEAIRRLADQPWLEGLS